MTCLLMVKNIFIFITKVYKMWGCILVFAVYFAVRRFVPDLSLESQASLFFLISTLFLYVWLEEIIIGSGGNLRDQLVKLISIL